MVRYDSNSSLLVRKDQEALRFLSVTTGADDESLHHIFKRFNAETSIHMSDEGFHFNDSLLNSFTSEIMYQDEYSEVQDSNTEQGSNTEPSTTPQGEFVSVNMTTYSPEEDLFRNSSRNASSFERKMRWTDTYEGDNSQWMLTYSN